MAHLPDGILSLPVLAAGAAIGAGGLVVGIRKMEAHMLPRTALVSAVFFVASLIHFPAGLGSVHLILGGLAGLMLGWAAFPAIAVGLILQAFLFGFGGLAVMGVNLTNIALPAVVFGLIGRKCLARPLLAGLLSGGGAVLATGLMVAASLALSGKEFWAAAQLAVLAALPLAAVESVAVMAVLRFLLKVKPEIFEENP